MGTMLRSLVFNILIVTSTILQDGIVSADGTIKEQSPFNPDGDAIGIYNAMKGFGTDEGTILSIATKRTRAQRLEIAKEYQNRYHHSIFKDFQGDLGGSFLTMMTALFQPIPVVYATGIRDAVKGYGTVDETLTGIFCCLQDGIMDSIIEAYKDEFNRNLIKDVGDDTSGDFKLLLQALMKGNRDSSKTYQFNETRSLLILQGLVRAGAANYFGTSEKEFIKVFSETSYMELAEVSRQQEKVLNYSLASSVKSETSGNFGDLLLQILLHAEDPVSYYVNLLKTILHRSYFDVVKNNKSTAPETLIRILVTRSELDLKEIKEEYERTTKKLLENDVMSATLGDFERACVSIIRGNE